MKVTDFIDTISSEKFIKELQKSRCFICAKRIEGCKRLDFGNCQFFKSMINKTKNNCKTCSCFYSCDDSYLFDNCPLYKKYIPRCNKCVCDFYNCGDSDLHGECKTYRRDPPNGGYYG
jgi:hypothetical protein